MDEDQEPIILPAPSRAERNIASASKGHCTVHAVLGDGAGVRMQAESHLEFCHFLVLNADRSIVDLQEQVRFRYGAHNEREHVFDVVATRTTGSRIPDGDPGKVDGLLSFDAVASELLADRMHASIPVLKMPGYLNCNRRQAELLVQHRIISRLGGGHADTILNMVPVADLDAFIARMRRRGLPVDRPGDGMVNVIVASEVVRWPVLDIVRLVLDDALSRIELLPAELKFKSVLVDPEEVRHAIAARQAKGRLSVDEVAKRLKTEPWCVRALASHHDRTGRPFLPASFEMNTKGAARAYFEIDDVEGFMSGHVDLKDLAEARGMTAKALRKQLSDIGIEPILPRPKLNRLIYRRADL